METTIKFRASAPRKEIHMDKTIEQNIDNIGVQDHNADKYLGTSYSRSAPQL